MLHAGLAIIWQEYFGERYQWDGALVLPTRKNVVYAAASDPDHGGAIPNASRVAACNIFGQVLQQRTADEPR